MFLIQLEGRQDVVLAGAWVSLEALGDFEERFKRRRATSEEGGEEGAEGAVQAYLTEVVADIEWGLLSRLFDFTVINDSEERALGDLKRAAAFLSQEPVPRGIAKAA